MSSATPTSAGPTFCDLFGLTAESLSASLDDKTLLEAVGDGKKTPLPAGSLPGLRGAVASRLWTALNDGSVAGACAGAWAKYADLMQCAKQTRDDPKSTQEVALAQHDFTFKLDPAFDVMLNGVNVGSIPFSFTADCAVNGLELSLERGSIVAVRAGKLDCSAKIACAGTTIWTRDVGAVNLPGELHLTRPIVLNGA
jgi:hypothetical protein